jgi:hypothetical protein
MMMVLFVGMKLCLCCLFLRWAIQSSSSFADGITTKEESGVYGCFCYAVETREGWWGEGREVLITERYLELPSSP